MITKMTETNILCGDISIPNWRRQFSIQMITKWQSLTFFVGAFKFQLIEPHIFCWDIQIPTGKKETLQYRIYFKYDRTLHPILCGDIQIPTEKCSSVSKWFQRSQNFTSFVGEFKSQLKKTV